MKIKLSPQLLFILILIPIFAVIACKGMAASAEEYFSIGMAYFEMGKYEEAEAWLNRARSADKTKVASEYNLGRLAFERKRYYEAADYFEDILKKDPDNVLALKAAAYTRIKTGDINIADRHYKRLLELVPESADDGYNHALVLHAMGRFSDAEALLEKYQLFLLENSDMQLLYARCQSAQNKVEAVNSYSNWLNNNTDAKVRSEYAKVLEENELYARAIEEYRKALTESKTKDLNASLHFSLAKVLLTADSGGNEGITEIHNAINEGFDDTAALEELLANNKISAVNKDSIRNIVQTMQRSQSQSEKAETGSETNS